MCLETAADLSPFYASTSVNVDALLNRALYDQQQDDSNSSTLFAAANTANVALMTSGRGTAAGGSGADDSVMSTRGEFFGGVGGR